MEIPARPKSLSLDGVRPCELFTAAQLSQLEIDREPRSRTTDDKYDAPACELAVDDQDPRFNYTVIAVTNEGMPAWLSGTRNVDAWLVSVGGYPAADFKLKGVDDEECSTSVDVADGQQLLIEVLPSTSVEYRRLCDMSEQAAALAVATLQSLK